MTGLIGGLIVLFTIAYVAFSARKSGPNWGGEQ